MAAKVPRVAKGTRSRIPMAGTSIFWPTSGELGSAEKPVGWGRGDFGAGSYLLGIQCECRCVFLALSGLVDSNQDVTCPSCGSNVRSR